MSTIRINLFGQEDETPSPVSPVLGLPEIPSSVLRYVDKFNDDTPTRFYCCRVRRLNEVMNCEVERPDSITTEKNPLVSDEPTPVVSDETTFDATFDDGWNESRAECECDSCLKAQGGIQLPNGGSITKTVFMSKNEPDDPELLFVHPYSLCILKDVQQFGDRFESNVMHFNNDLSFIFEDFMRVNHKLAKNASMTNEWINLVGTHMLNNPKYALGCKSVYGNKYCAFVMQHMLIQTDNPHVVELLRCFMKMNGKCPVLFLERFQKSQRDSFKNVMKF